MNTSAVQQVFAVSLPEGLRDAVQDQYPVAERISPERPLAVDYRLQANFAAFAADDDVGGPEVAVHEVCRFHLVQDLRETRQARSGQARGAAGADFHA